MARTTIIGALLAGASVFAGAAGALAEDDVQAWLNGDYATGDWGGARTKLEEIGITPEAAYTTNLMAVTNGNAGSGDGWDYAGRLGASLDFDLEKLVGLPGLSFYASGAWSSGSDLSEHQVGNLFAVQQIYTGQKVRLSQLYLKQDLLDDRLSFKIGRLTTEEDFLSSEIFANYVNGGINGTPANIPGDNAGFTTAPFAQWGVVGAYEPVDDLRFALGVYNGDEKANDDKRHGVDFALDGDAVLVVGEVAYGWNQPPKEKDESALEDDGAPRETNQPEQEETEPVPGMPGQVKVGALFESGNREDLSNGRRKEGSPGFYVSLQQMVYQESLGSDQGLTPWGVITYQPRQSINTIPVFFGTGLVYKGLIPTRDEDNAAIGFYYGRLSSDIEPAGSEKILEFAYTAQLTKWFYVRPDLQLVFDPAGVNSAGTAVVGGGEIGIIF